MFRQIFDGIREALESGSFTTHADHYRAFSSREDGKHVFFYMGDWTPKNGSRGKHYDYTVEYLIDCLVVSSSTTESGEPISAGVNAGKALRSLLAEVMGILFHYQNLDFGLDPGVIGSRELPRVETFIPEGEEGNRITIGCRIRLLIPTFFEPTGADGPQLLEIGVEAPAYSADIPVEPET